MPDALAKLIAIQAAGCKVQTNKTHSGAPPAMVGVPAGEVVWGSWGVLDTSRW